MPHLPHDRDWRAGQRGTCEDRARDAGQLDDEGITQLQTMHEIEMPADQRERFEAIKDECHTPDTPRPPDVEILDSLMDTWELVGEGHYSELNARDEDRERITAIRGRITLTERHGKRVKFADIKAPAGLRGPTDAEHAAREAIREAADTINPDRHDPGDVVAEIIVWSDGETEIKYHERVLEGVEGE